MQAGMMLQCMSLSLQVLQLRIHLLFYFCILFSIPLNIRYDTIGPTIAIENAFAPNVVKPPWASNIAWNNKTIVPSTTVTPGPNSIALRPTPVGCEQLPFTDGILRADSTNTKAPHKANSTFSLALLSLFYWLILYQLWRKV